MLSWWDGCPVTVQEYIARYKWKQLGNLVMNLSSNYSVTFNQMYTTNYSGYME